MQPNPKLAAVRPRCQQCCFPSDNNNSMGIGTPVRHSAASGLALINHAQQPSRVPTLAPSCAICAQQRAPLGSQSHPSRQGVRPAALLCARRTYVVVPHTAAPKVVGTHVAQPHIAHCIRPAGQGAVGHALNRDVGLQAGQATDAHGWLVKRVGWWAAADSGSRRSGCRGGVQHPWQQPWQQPQRCHAHGMPAGCTAPRWPG